MEKATFVKENHTYFLGDKQLISVTQLLKKHGLSSSYYGVNEEVLRLKAERGTLIHEEIERYIKHGELGFTPEQDDFIKISAELGLINMVAEEIVNNDIVAGTVDLMAERARPEFISTALIDYKTSVSVNKEACRWQLSLYERLSGRTFDEFFVIHLGDNSRLIPIERIPAEEIDKLLECERNGTIYQARALEVSVELIENVKAAEQEIKRIELMSKAAVETAERWRAALLEAMRKQGIKSFETSDKSVLITYIEPSERETIDSKRLKEELPDIAKKYTKTSKVKDSVRITVR